LLLILFRWLFSASSDSILVKRAVFARTSEVCLPIYADVDAIGYPTIILDISGTVASSGNGSKDFSTGVAGLVCLNGDTEHLISASSLLTSLAFARFALGRFLISLYW